MRLACFGIGYAVWLVDEFACGLLTSCRHAIGLPWAFVLELHGWWHFLTAIGGYVAVSVIDVITTEDVRDDPTGLFAWPVPQALRLLTGSDKRETALKES